MDRRRCQLLSASERSGIEQSDVWETAVFLTEYNDVYGNTFDYWNVLAGVGDLSVNPEFVGAGPNLAAALHIAATSPVRSTGSATWAPLRDFDSDWRLSGGTVSMGADEIPGTEIVVYLPLVARDEQ